MRLPLLLSIFSSLAAAVNITHPIVNSTIAAGSSSKIVWDHVDTDPKSLSLYLVNFVNWPPSYVPLAFDKDTADGSAKVKIPCHTPPSWGYQINAINGTNVYVIYAQSAKFFVSPAADLETCVDDELPVPPECTAENKQGGEAPAFFSSSAIPQHPDHSNAGAVIGWRSGYGDPMTLN